VIDWTYSGVALTAELRRPKSWLVRDNVREWCSTCAFIAAAQVIACVTAQDMNENIEERVNLQKALFEIEDANVLNRYELRQLDEFLEAGEG
jgi:hypothetical protein